MQELTTGYARVIVHSTLHGIEKIEEGHFNKGSLFNFGRTHAMEKTIPSEFYSHEQHYTGWFPDIGTTFVGNGIAVTDRVAWQGEFQGIEGFPNGGRDLVSPPGDLDKFTISTFAYRTEIRVED